MISTAEMKSLEDMAESKGISKFTLMENAGKQVSDILEQNMELKGKRILIVCNHGNNGGDGFVAARYLCEKAEVELLFLGDETKLKPEGEENFRKIEKNPMVQFIGLDYVNFDDYDIIIDAILGTGIEGDLKPMIRSTIEAINKADAFKLSIDVPSGVNPDTGEISDLAVNPDLLVTFHDIKNGLQGYADRIVIADIGIPK